MLETRIALGLLVIAIVGTSVISLSLVGLTPDVIQAFASAALNPQDVAKFMIVRITVDGTNEQMEYGSFTRLGYLSGEADFLLESLPSIDKRPFYKLVQKSLDKKDSIINKHTFDMRLDLFSGGNEHIETLVYTTCHITDYFVHTIDSRGKVRFLADGNTDIEIREVTKFDCIGFNVSLER